MGKRRILLVLALVALAAAVGGYEEEERWREKFLLQESKQVVRSEAGSTRVVRGYPGGFIKSSMHIGFITMEPNSLFIPQYLDSSLILFIRRGGARVGHIYKHELVEIDLKMGDIYRIGAGSGFYLINTAEGQRLHIICSIDASQSSGWHTFHSFFIAGGTNPRSVLAGFDPLTLSTAFNVTEEEVRDMLTRQERGPMVYLTGEHSPSVWSKFVDMEKDEKTARMKRIVRIGQDDLGEEQSIWSFRKFLVSVFGRTDRKKGDKRASTGKGPDAYNLYDRKPDFRNNYGWSIALDESDYAPLLQY